MTLEQIRDQLALCNRNKCGACVRETEDNCIAGGIERKTRDMLIEAINRDLDAGKKLVDAYEKEIAAKDERIAKLVERLHEVSKELADQKEENEKLIDEMERTGSSCTYEHVGELDERMVAEICEKIKQPQNVVTYNTNKLPDGGEWTSITVGPGAEA